MTCGSGDMLSGATVRVYERRHVAVYVNTKLSRPDDLYFVSGSTHQERKHN